MGKFTVSVAHGLRLVSVSDILYFGIIQTRVFMKTVGEPEDLKIVPGSFVPEDAIKDGFYSKKHNFKLPDVSRNKTVYLENLKKGRYLAFYVDENGNERVSGSPDNPLSLSYEIKGGLYSCTLTGLTVDPDAFI